MERMDHLPRSAWITSLGARGSPPSERVDGLPLSAWMERVEDLPRSAWIASLDRVEDLPRNAWMNSLMASLARASGWPPLIAWMASLGARE